jgi:hypothetical protein
MTIRRRRSPLATRRLEDFDLRTQLWWLSGWSLNCRRDTPWHTWSDYLGDYESIRDEFLAHWGVYDEGRQHWRTRRIGHPIFAEQARAFAAAHGLAALEAAEYGDIKYGPEEDEDA